MCTSPVSPLADTQSGITLSSKFSEHLNSLPSSVSLSEWSRTSAAKIASLVESKYGLKSAIHITPCISSDGNRFNASTVLSVVRPARSDGTETIILSSSYGRIRAKSGELDGLGLLSSLILLLQEAPWLARDHIFIFAPDICEKPCYADVINRFHNDPTWHPEFARSEPIAALHFQMPPAKGIGAITIDSDGSFGQLPNLDLVSSGNSLFLCAQNS